MQPFSIDEVRKQSRLRWSMWFFTVSIILFTANGFGIYLGFTYGELTTVMFVLLWTMLAILGFSLIMSVVMLARVFRFKDTQKLLEIRYNGIKVSGLPLIEWPHMLGVVISDTHNITDEESALKQTVQKFFRKSGGSFVSLVIGVDDIDLLKDREHQPAGVDRGAGNTALVTLALDVMLRKDQWIQLTQALEKSSTQAGVGFRRTKKTTGLIGPVMEMSQGRKIALNHE